MNIPLLNSGLNAQGYKKVISNCVENAKALSDGISAIGRFKLLSKPVGVPVVAFSLLDESEHDEHELADELKRYGWSVPAYTMAPDAQNVTLLRVVVREDFSHGLVDRLVTDIKRVLAKLDSKPSKLVRKVADAMKDDDKAAAEHVKASKQPPAHDDSGATDASVFSDAHNKRGHFNVHKKHGLRKSNGVC